MLSIVIVNYNAGTLLARTIASVYAETDGVIDDVWVVDNASTDDSLSGLEARFPKVRLIRNESNVGFAKANNQVLSECSSEYVLLLNPDTLVLEGAIDKCVDYMERNPKIGICGCKVLNEDGSLQLACRRSIPTPQLAFWRLTGLSKMFPKSRRLARYNLTYLDADQPHEVEAVSGAFLLIRKSVVDQVGPLDEQFFMHGEELDWCLRARQAGWNIAYYPEARIVHYKGECSKTNSRKAKLEFYRSMHLFYRKHYAAHHSPVFNWLVYAAIWTRAAFSWRRLLFAGKVGSSR